MLFNFYLSFQTDFSMAHLQALENQSMSDMEHKDTRIEELIRVSYMYECMFNLLFGLIVEDM